MWENPPYKRALVVDPNLSHWSTVLRVAQRLYGDVQSIETNYSQDWNHFEAVFLGEGSYQTFKTLPPRSLPRAGIVIYDNPIVGVKTEKMLEKLFGSTEMVRRVNRYAGLLDE